MEPQTGEILAMASWPVFDPNNYGNTNLEVFRNPVISEQYEPGSIFKIITMAAGLDTGVIEPSTTFTDTGIVTLGQRIFFNSNRLAYGNVTTTEALARSLNVVTVQVVERIGKNNFYQYLRRFGFGDATDVDLSGEIAGAIKLPNNPNWSVSDLGTNSFGQGIAVTPLQMLNATAAIANGGSLMRPYVVRARVQGDTALLIEPTVVRTVISPETSEMLTEMMVTVVETGALGARVEGYTIAGKTGTAQIPTEEGYTEDETIVSFVGFAPADDPQFVALIKLVRPDPEISPWATYTAAPAFAELAKRLFEHMNIPPDDVRLGKVAKRLE